MTLTNVAFALAYRTWADGLGVGFAFSAERIAVQLRDDVTIPALVLADPYRSRVTRMVPGRRAQAPPFSADPTRRLIHPYRWRRAEPVRHAEAVRLMGRLDRLLQTEIPASDAVLVTSHPVLAAVADRSAWRDVTYYAYDDFRGVPGCYDLVSWAHEEVAKKDVNVVAVTDFIVSIVGARRSTVVPNGIVAAEFAMMEPVPTWFTQLRGRIAFYAGSLQRRIDVGAIADLARDLGPGWTIVLVGPMQDPAWFQPLEGLSNVVVRAEEPRSRVLSMMASADVCLVPHLPETEGMSPLKVFEYLGTGATVVATDLGPMRGLSPRCLLVPPGKGWPRRCLRPLTCRRRPRAMSRTSGSSTTGQPATGPGDEPSSGIESRPFTVPGRVTRSRRCHGSSCS